MGLGLLAKNVDTLDDTFRNALRVRTWDVHQQLHKHSHFVALFDGTIDIAQYLALMQAFHGFYSPLEQAIECALQKTTNVSGRFQYASRAKFLWRDLKDLGESAAQIDQHPKCSGLSNIVTPASLGGVLYVIEGSTLGAAQIDRAAAKILDKDSTRGRNFWAWCRTNNKGHWAAINTHLSQLEQARQPRDALLKGASDTFEALANWLDPLQQPNTTQVGAVS